jgi:hypothetical protein
MYDDALSDNKMPTVKILSTTGDYTRCDKSTANKSHDREAFQHRFHGISPSKKSPGAIVSHQGRFKPPNNSPFFGR